jgi:uracil permease
MKLIYDVQDKPKLSQTIVFAFQQMIAIMAATLLVPMIMTGYGLPTDPAAALFGAGIGSLVYIFFTKKRSPVFLGSSFTFLGAYSATIAQNYGYIGVLIGIGFAGLVYVIIALVIKGVGSAWVNKLMPAVIIGPIVALIGLSLSGTATSWLASNGGDDYNFISIIVGLVTFFAIVVASVKGSKTIKLIPFIVGIAVGYVLALVLTLIGMAAGIESLQVLSFQSFTDAFSPFGITSIIDYPKWFILRAIQTKGEYAAIDLAAIGNIALIFVPIAVVELAQHIADHKNLGSIIERDLITDPGLDRTLLGDGVGSIIGGIFGCCANTTYGESIGCVAITGNASIITIMTAAIGCMVLSFFTPFVALINSIPKCVMGGACIALYGFIAVSGLQMLKKVDLGDSRNLFVVSAILVTGIGGLTFEFGHNSLTGGSIFSITSLAVALIVGIITNLIVNGGKMGTGESTDGLTGAVESMGTVEIEKEEK